MRIPVCIAVFLLVVLHHAEGRRKKGNRIISGRPALIEEFPYQVTLERAGRHFCGGSIIHKSIILTAAHCTMHLTSLHDVEPDNMAVRVGTSLSGQRGVLHRVKEAKRHEGYHDLSEVDTHDIALILLQNPIEFNKNAQKIKLAANPPPVGAKGWITGFGSQIQSNSRSNTANQLMAVELPVVSIVHCLQKMKSYGGVVADDMFCAGKSKGNEDACRGDSGGPFQINGVLYGAVAWGIGCGQEGLPGVYTDLHQYRDWLESTSAKLLKDM